MKGKVRSWHIFVLIILAALLGGEFFSVSPNWLLKSLAALEPPIVTPIPAPTEIDQNFLNQVDKCFIPAAAAYGYTLRITSGFRSEGEQNQLYNQGRTENGHIISWAEPGKSLHNYGYAIDVVDRWKGYDVDWKKIAKIGEFCGLEQVDDPHFEHRSGLTVADFSAGMRPPLLTLPCFAMGERPKGPEGQPEPLTLDDLNNCSAPKF
jgi:hypothetical protein